MKNSSPRTGLLRADILSIIILIGFVGLAYFTDSLLVKQPETTGLVMIGLVLSAVPALIWIGLFYRKDSEEPEPRVLVFKVFLLGALVYEGLGRTILNSLFRVDSWLYQTGPAMQIIGGFLIVGMVQEYLKYASVRFSVFSSEEFDGPTDGIIYATATGIGFATAMNVRFVLESGGLNLGLGAIHITLTVLAHAGFSGIVGYFMGRQKIENKSFWWMPAGLVLSAACNSLFVFVRANLIQGGLGRTRLWLGILISVLFTGGISFILSRLIARDNRCYLEGGTVK